MGTSLLRQISPKSRSMRLTTVDPDDCRYAGVSVAGGALCLYHLSKFRPERLDSGEIVVRWITESELNNAGFNILRSDARDGEFTKINTKLIAGQGTIRVNVPFIRVSPIHLRNPMSSTTTRSKMFP